jgi:hypothetical protein
MEDKDSPAPTANVISEEVKFDTQVIFVLYSCNY